MEKKGILTFVIFSRNLFNEYIKLFENENLENLFLLRNLAIKIANSSSLPKTLSPLEYSSIIFNLKKCIHETGFYLSTNKKLTNIELLNFLKEDKDYIKYNNDDIFEGLNLYSIDEEFMKEWKSFDWKKIFGKDINEKIIDMIIDFKSFGAVFKLLKINIDIDKEKFSSDSLKWMQIKFINLLEQQNNIEEKDFKDYLIELIYYSHLGTKNELPKFLESLEDKIKPEIMKNIYYELIKNYYEKISNEMRNSISLYIIKNQNYDILVAFAENFKFFLPYILNNISDKPEKKDFWVLEENKNLKLLKCLIEKADLFSEYIMENSNYAKNSFELLNQLKEELNKNQVEYKDINIFFENNKENEKNEFKKRLSLIYYNDEPDKVEDNYNRINQKIEHINNALKDLKLIYDYCNYFFKNSQKENIKEIESIISSINDGPLNYYENNENNCSEKYNKLVKEFKQDAEKRTEMQKSIFFSGLYDKNKEIKNSEENDWIQKTEEQFNKLKNIFTKKGIESIDVEIVATCLNAISTTEKTIDEIRQEIHLLYKIFQIKDSDDKEKIVKKIRLLSKRDEIREILKSIYNFVHYTGAIETRFKKSLIENINNLKESYNEDKINKAINKLKEANIDITGIIDKSNSSENNYLNILQMLTEQSITFLLKVTLDDCQTLREKVGDESFVIDQNDIIDLEKCDSFMRLLQEEKNFSRMKDSKLIEKFINKINGAKENFGIFFKNYTTNFIEIKKLFDSIKDRSEAKRDKILYISKNSEFILKNTNTEFFYGFYYDEEIVKKKRQKKINQK